MTSSVGRGRADATRAAPCHRARWTCRSSGPRRMRMPPFLTRPRRRLPARVSSLAWGFFPPLIGLPFHQLLFVYTLAVSVGSLSRVVELSEKSCLSIVTSKLAFSRFRVLACVAGRRLLSPPLYTTLGESRKCAQCSTRPPPAPCPLALSPTSSSSWALTLIDSGRSRLLPIAPPQRYSDSMTKSDEQVIEEFNG